MRLCKLSDMGVCRAQGLLFVFPGFVISTVSYLSLVSDDGFAISRKSGILFFTVI